MIGKVTLKQARHLAGLSQNRASELIGITANTLRSYEAGKTFPDAKTISEIEQVYGIKYNDIDFLCRDKTV